MIPFSPPRIDQEVIDEVIDTLKSGWITTGPKTLKFEDELTQYCGNKATVCLNSATAGLQLMLDWFGVGPGDEVIVPAYTYCATGNVVNHSGAKLVLVDIKDDFNIDVASVKKAITNKTKVIMPVDIGGYPCDYDSLNTLVNSTEIKSLFTPNTQNQKKLGRILILADAAHSFGGIYKNKRIGSVADVSVFSFHAVKNLSTAEGGAIALNLPEGFDQQEIRKQLKVRSLHGQSKDAFSKLQVGAWKYDVEASGFKCNMTDINASMGLVELRRYDTNLTRRKEIFDLYTKAFSTKSWAIIPPYNTPLGESSYHLFLLRIKDITEEMRGDIIAEISKQQVAVNVHFIPLPMLTAFKNSFNIKAFPNTYVMYQNEITLPVYYNLTNEQTEIVIKTVIQSVEKIIA